MNLVVSDKAAFVNNFLVPISKVTNSAVINVKNHGYHTLISTNDNTIILDASFACNGNNDGVILNVPDLSKLIRILSVIDTDNITLQYNQNNLSYSSENVRFKYHLFEDGIIVSPKLNVDKLSALTFDGKFTLNFTALQNLIKGSSIATDSNKIYLSFKQNKVIGELTDKSRPNVDSYGLTISENYAGIQLANFIPLNFEVFRIISSMRFKELNCALSSKTGVFVFETNTSPIAMKFIISALAN